MRITQHHTVQAPPARQRRLSESGGGRFKQLVGVLERRPVRIPVVVATMLVAVVATALRAIHLGRSFDLYYDELVYFQISDNVTRALHLTYDGKSPVYLHPPAFFAIEAAFLRLLSPGGNVVHRIYDVRYVNAVLGGLSAAALFVIGRCVAGWRAGSASALLFALDPFIIRINSRNLLQTSAIFFVLVGYCIIVYCVNRPHSWRCALGAGCAFGIALLANEPVAFITLLPLGVCLLLNWAIPRRSALLIGVTACMIYTVYPLGAAVNGTWKAFQDQKLTGVRRLVGLLRVSGFSRSHGPSFSAAVSADVSQFATTYALIALGAIATGILLLYGRSATRLIGVWAASGYFLLAYSIEFGTNEEQYFYYLIVLAILATVTGCALILRSRWLGDRARKAARVTAALLLVALVLWTGRVWVHIHSTPDNGYERLSAYLEKNVPQHSRIAATTITSAALFNYSNYVFNEWDTPEEVKDNHARYAVISPQLIAKGYGEGTPELQSWLAHHARLVFVFKGPSYGALEFYRIPPNAVTTAPTIQRFVVVSGRAGRADRLVWATTGATRVTLDGRPVPANGSRAVTAPMGGALYTLQARDGARSAMARGRVAGPDSVAGASAPESCLT